jgi:chorismate mutase/prephenate dehydratase
MFEVAHSPGALADALMIFKANKVNLTWIESFPTKAVKGEYIFFVDFDGHADDARVKKAIKSLEETCEAVQVLGSFPAAKAIED